MKMPKLVLAVSQMKKTRVLTLVLVCVLAFSVPSIVSATRNNTLKVNATVPITIDGYATWPQATVCSLVQTSQPSAYYSDSPLNVNATITTTHANDVLFLWVNLDPPGNRVTNGLPETVSDRAGLTWTQHGTPLRSPDATLTAYLYWAAASTPLASDVITIHSCYSAVAFAVSGILNPSVPFDPTVTDGTGNGVMAGDMPPTVSNANSTATDLVLGFIATDTMANPFYNANYGIITPGKGFANCCNSLGVAGLIGAEYQLPTTASRTLFANFTVAGGSGEWAMRAVAVK
jgi:hypothetical protein